MKILGLAKFYNANLTSYLLTLSSIAYFSCSVPDVSSRDHPKEGAVDSTVRSRTSAKTSDVTTGSTDSLDSIIGSTVDAEVAVLNNGAEYLNARWDLLNAAKKTVWIQSYILKGDYTGKQFVKKLLELKAKGIEVKVIIDEQINLDPGAQGLFANAYQSGLKIVGFNPLYTGVIFPLAKTGDIATYLNVQNKRSHEKLFIIDPEDAVNGRAIIGGANISDDYFELVKAPTGGYWRDKDVLLRGPIVHKIAKYFTQSYAYHETLNGNIVSKDSTIRTDLTAAIQKLLFKKTDDLPESIANFNDHITRPFNPAFVQSKMSFLIQSPALKRQDIYNEYLKLINSATSAITIVNGYFIPDATQTAALKAAAARGVKVQILTNSEETTDFPQVARASRLTYESVLSDASLPITIREWGIPGAKAFALYHSKFMCVDNTKCIVGSFNFDPRSHNLNSESAVSFDSAEAAAALIKTFEEDSSPETSTAVTLEIAKGIGKTTNAKDLILNALIRTFIGNF